MKKVFVFVTILIIFFFKNNLMCQTGWFQLNSGTSNELRSVYFNNANTGWVLGFNGSVLKTTNGGINWFSQSPNSSIGYLSCSFLNMDTGWICGSNNAIYKTTNGGNSWINQSYSSSSRLFSICFPSENIGFAVGDYGLIIKTTNGGQSWEKKILGLTNNLIDVEFINSNTGWIIGDNGVIIKTISGGNEWVFQSSGINYNLQNCRFLNENTGWISSDGGIILKTSNGGSLWSVKHNAGSTLWLGSVFFPNANTGFVVGGNYNTLNNPILLKSTNGGENWISQNSPASTWFGSCHFINENTGWSVGKAGVIIKTVTGGVNVPPPPVLIYPVNNSSNISLTPAMTWSNAYSATHYSIQISPVLDFSFIIDSCTTISNQYVVPLGKLSPSSTYFWRVSSKSALGSSPWSEVWCFSTKPIGIKEYSKNIPIEYKIYSNYPNPFNPITKIIFDLPKKSHTNLVVFNALGEKVETLINTELKEGSYEYTWNAEKYNSGIYYIRMVCDKFIDTKKTALIK